MERHRQAYPTPLESARIRKAQRDVPAIPSEDALVIGGPFTLRPKFRRFYQVTPGRDYGIIARERMTSAQLAVAREIEAKRVDRARRRLHVKAFVNAGEVLLGLQLLAERCAPYWADTPSRTVAEALELAQAAEVAQ